MQSWAVKYRPKTFEDIAGQPEKAYMRLLLRKEGEMPPLFIFQGPSGVGKTTAARVFAAALNCENRTDKEDPCTVCGSCVAILSDAHPSVYEHNSAYKNGAADMREIQENAQLQGEANVTVFILDEAQTLSSQAWRVLLKLFEEPPVGCVFILVTSEPGSIPEAIRTRSLTFSFGLVPENTTVEILEKVCAAENVSMVDGVEHIVDMAGGRVREAIMLLEQTVKTGVAPKFLNKKALLARRAIQALSSGDQKTALASLEGLWSFSGNAKEVFALLGTELQRVLYRLYGLQLLCSTESVRVYDEIAKGIGESKLSLIFEEFSNAKQGMHDKVSILFLWSRVEKIMK